MSVKDHLRELIDEMPEYRAIQVQRYIEALKEAGDPVLAALEAAPEDDELETEEERTAVAEGRADLSAGRVVRDEDLDRELGWA